MKDTQKEKLKAITGLDAIPFVTAGIAADTAGYVVSEDALTRLVEAAETGEAAQATLATVQAELATANTTLTAAQAAATAAQTELATANTELATAQARIAVLEAQDGGDFSAADALNDAEGNLKAQFKTSADIEIEKMNAQ
jgi:predicted  nucleic acid-binding Zn-ribbon protein